MKFPVCESTEAIPSHKYFAGSWNVARREGKQSVLSLDNKNQKQPPCSPEDHE